VICPACQRANQPARRYCGGCGCNFDPACGGCGFANERADRFCGGCGAELRAGAARPRRELATAPTLASNPATATASAAATTAPWTVDELAGLFEPVAASADEHTLPEAGISQDHLDRLFGASS
jgi:hypothetical protein